MLNVVCVLRTGGEYNNHHVEALSAQVWDHLSLPHRFVCLTDIPKHMPRGVEGIKLPDNWPGWWSKICLFKEGLFDGPVFYLDLDTMIIKSIDFIADGIKGFTVLKNFWPQNTGQIGSGLMSWDEDLSIIYNEFKKSPLQVMDAYKVRKKWGDQGFIFDTVPNRFDLWQEKYPGKIVSWKLHCQAGVPEEAAIVCFHGQPRPWNSPLWPLAVKAMNYESKSIRSKHHNSKNDISIAR